MALIVPGDETEAGRESVMKVNGHGKLYQISEKKKKQEFGENDAKESTPLQETVTVDWRERINLSHVEDGKLRTRIFDILASHESVWDGNLGTIRATSHQIDVAPGTKPIRSMPYRQGPSVREIIREHVETMLKANIIEPTSSEWASPVVLIPKKDRRLRFCVDYRKLNEKKIRDTYPLPRMDDCIDSLGDATIFSIAIPDTGKFRSQTETATKRRSLRISERSVIFECRLG